MHEILFLSPFNSTFDNHNLAIFHPRRNAIELNMNGIEHKSMSLSLDPCEIHINWTKIYELEHVSLWNYGLNIGGEQLKGVPVKRLRCYPFSSSLTSSSSLPFSVQSSNPNHSISFLFWSFSSASLKKLNFGGGDAWILLNSALIHIWRRWLTGL